MLSALSRCGFDPTRLCDTLTGIPSWTEFSLHLLVANFLRVRFPILLALNKSDSPDAERFVAQVRERLPLEKSVPTSAACEWWLHERTREGLVAYQEGGSAATMAADAQLKARMQP